MTDLKWRTGEVPVEVPVIYQVELHDHHGRVCTETLAGYRDSDGCMLDPTGDETGFGELEHDNVERWIPLADVLKAIGPADE